MTWVFKRASSVINCPSRTCFGRRINTPLLNTNASSFNLPAFTVFFSYFWEFSKGLTSVSQPGAATVAQRVGPGTFCSSILLCRERPAGFSILPGIFHNLLPQGIFSSQSLYLGRSCASPDFKRKSGTWAWTLVHSFLGPFDWFKMVKWSNQGQDTMVFLLSILGEEVRILSTGPELLADISMPRKIKSWKVDPKKSGPQGKWLCCQLDSYNNLKAKTGLLFSLLVVGSWHLSSSHCNKEWNYLIGRAVRWCLGLKAVWSLCQPIYQLPLSPCLPLSSSLTVSPVIRGHSDSIYMFTTATWPRNLSSVFTQMEWNHHW